VLPYLFSILALVQLSLLLSLKGGRRGNVLYWFWSVAVYGSCLPVAAWHVVVHLLGFKKPRFERTPKRGDAPGVPALTGLAVPSIGVITCLLAWLWPSPFSPMASA
jgi:hypothetical protein